jgi:serralysin
MSLVTGNNSIDSLVYSSWNGSAHTPITLHYSFMTTLPSLADATDAKGFAPMNAEQKAAVRHALDLWSSVANITFVEVAQGGELLMGTNDQGKTSAGYAYLPDEHSTQTMMFTNNLDRYNNVFTPGTYGPTVLLHEIGHMLGLKHPGNYDSAGQSIDGPFLPDATDNADYTQMSYSDPVSYALLGKHPSGPMLYDIQAIQYLYGANAASHAGDDRYAFTDAAVPSCIWDAGGTNVFDFSQCLRATTINLRAGEFSETAAGLHNVSIAYGSVINVAIAGAGGSTITANDSGDRITGGAGGDEVFLGLGSDVVEGMGGVDTVVFGRRFADYTIVRAGASITVSGDGNDVLTGVEQLRFSDRTVSVSDLAQLPARSGGAGNDSFAAQVGNEAINGGSGTDTVVYGGRLADYTVVKTGAGLSAGFSVTDKVGTGGVDSLSGIERLHFADASVVLDSDPLAGQLYRLYGAMFNRAPEADGLGFWIRAREQGVTMDAIAGAFVGSAEFIRLYGSNLGDKEFITALYAHALHRAPDADGLAFHLDFLQHGGSRNVELIGFSESPEFIASLVGVMPAAQQYIPYQA